MRTFILILTCLIFMGLQSCNKKTPTATKEAPSQQATKKVTKEPAAKKPVAKQEMTKQEKIGRQENMDYAEKLMKETKEKLKNPNLSAEEKQKLEEKIGYIKEKMEYYSKGGN